MIKFLILTSSFHHISYIISLSLIGEQGEIGISKRRERESMKNGNLKIGQGKYTDSKLSRFPNVFRIIEFFFRHAGYSYSGRVAAFAFKQIVPETV